MKITVIGGGHVGLPAAVGFAAIGHRVVCCEKNQARREMAAAGKTPFVDEGLEAALKQGIAAGRLRFCAGIAEAVADADLIFIAVLTKAGKGGLKILQTAAMEAGRTAPKKSVLVIKSTVPPGTCEQLEKALANKIPVASNPEFLRQGTGLYDFLNPTRIVCGADDARAARLLKKAYSPIVAKGAAYIATNRASAEIAKLAANMMLASRVALINELADLCEGTGAAIDEVTKAVSADERIGKKYLSPGVGFGGGCLPKDGQLLLQRAGQCGVTMPAVKAIYQSNNARAAKIAKRLLAALPPRPVVAVWGMAFKPDSDDLQTSPAVHIIRALCAGGATVQAHDPKAEGNVPANMPTKCKIVNDKMTALKNANMLAVLVGHREYLKVPPAKIKQCLKGKHIFDGAEVFNRQKILKAGLTLHAVGAKEVQPPGAA